MKYTTTITRAGVALAAGALALTPAAANAETIVPIEYDVQGNSHIARPNANVALGPTKLTTNLDVDSGDFTGSLPLPGTRTSFKIAGLLPVTADVDFIPTAPVTGHINLSGSNADVNATAIYTVKLSNVKVAGFPTFTGNRCQTKAPVTIPVRTRPGEGFDLVGGGALVGDYTIGRFENCGLNTPLINALVPGPGNTVELDVTNGVFG